MFFLIQIFIPLGRDTGKYSYWVHYSLLFVGNLINKKAKWL